MLPGVAGNWKLHCPDWVLLLLPPLAAPVCCPSRTNLWRGQFSHNTNFTDVLSPHGTCPRI